MGVEEMKAALMEFPAKVATKHLRRGLREGAKVIRLQCVADAPVRTGLTRSAIKVRAGKKKRNTISAMVAIGEGDFKGDTFYAGMVNYGWRVGSRKLGLARRFVPGTRWLNKAFDKSKDLALQVFMYIVQKGIEEEAAAARTVR